MIYNAKGHREQEVASLYLSVFERGAILENAANPCPVWFLIVLFKLDAWAPARFNKVWKGKPYTRYQP